MTQPVTEPSVAEIAESARLLVPPTGVIHIGAGNGTGAMHAWQGWSVPGALLVDADEHRLDWAKDSAAAKNWQIKAATLGAESAEQDYFLASNPAESGLVAVQKLNSIWPNLKTIRSERRTIERLDKLLDAGGSQALAANWVVIDCLPALHILKGAGDYIDRWSVLWLRVAIDESVADIYGANLSEIEAYLQPHGYRLAGISEGNHPALGEALFFRDWAEWSLSQREAPIRQNVQLRKEKDALEAEEIRLKESNLDLGADLARLEKDGERLHKELHQALDKLAKTEDQLMQMESKANAQKDAQAGAEARLTQVVEESVFLAEARAQAEQRWHALHEEHETLQAGNEKLQQQFSRVQEELINAKRQLTDFHASEASHIEVIARLEAELQLRSRDIAALAHAKLELEELLQKVKEDVAGPTASSQMLMQQMDEERSRFVDLENRHMEALVTAEAGKDAKALLEARVLDISKELDESKQDMAALQKNFLQAQLARDALAEAQKELQKQLVEARADATHMRKQADASAADQARIFSLLQEKSSTADQEVQDLQKRGVVLENEVQDLRQSAALLETEAVKNRKKIEEGGRQIQDAVTKAEQAFKSHDEQARLAGEAQTQFDKANARLKELEKLNESLKTQIAERDARQRVLSDETIKAEAQISLIKDVLLRERGI